jgi:glycosyltransferase involved in cell wall biosynthesis
VTATASGAKQGPLQVVYVNYWYEPGMESLDDLLSIYATEAQWTRTVAAAGAEVTVLQRFSRNARVERDGVRFLLRRDDYAAHLGKWQAPRTFHHAARDLCDRPGVGQIVFHLNGLHFPVQLRALRAALPPESRIIVQHHAERPARGLRRLVQGWGLRAADGFLFAAEGLAKAWSDHGLITPQQPVYEVMEGSTDFRRQDRAAARARTGLAGDPVVLWVGRLIGLKDPLTVLRGFEMVLRQTPGSRLYMAFSNNDLLSEVRDCIARSAVLSCAVSLLGRLPHADLEAVYNSSDYFVLGSHYEGSGYALTEALACGVVPVVTNIESFRVLTDQGRIGACWTPGDSTAFAEAFQRARSEPLPEVSERATRFFDEHLSWPAIARKAICAYGEMAGRGPRR